MPSAKLFTRQRLVCYHRTKAIPPISRTESTVIKTSGIRLTILAAGIFVFVLAFSAIFASQRRIKQKPPAEINPPAAKTKILFYAETSFSSEEDFDEEGKIDLITLLVKAELVPSRSEGRRAIQQGGVSIDGEKLTDIYHTVEKDAFAGDGIVLKRGKKKFKKICVK